MSDITRRVFLKWSGLAGLLSMLPSLWGRRRSSAPKPSKQPFYVDSRDGDDANPGTEPARPMRTLAEAIDRAVDGRGDVIYLVCGEQKIDRPLTIDKANLSISGGLFHVSTRYRPTFCFTRPGGRFMNNTVIGADGVEPSIGACCLEGPASVSVCNIFRSG